MTVYRLLRRELLQAALDCDHEPAIDAALLMFRTWQSGNYSLPPNLRSIVYKAGVR